MSVNDQFIIGAQLSSSTGRSGALVDWPAGINYFPSRDDPLKGVSVATRPPADR